MIAVMCSWGFCNEKHLIYIDKESAIMGITFEDCLACEGTGIFHEPEDKVKCNVCKGSGKIPVSC